MRTLLLLATFALLSGCVNGVRGATNLASVQVQTLREAYATLGEPDSSRTLPGGGTELIWSTRRAMGGNMRATLFSVPLATIERTTTSREWLVLDFAPDGHIQSRRFGSTNQSLSWCPWPGR
ncbi:MAG: hypothetical protein ACI4QD_04700 [Kiritimatiellia bacterium]